MQVAAVVEVLAGDEAQAGFAVEAVDALGLGDFPGLDLVFYRFYHSLTQIYAKAHSRFYIFYRTIFGVL